MQRKTRAQFVLFFLVAMAMMFMAAARSLAGPAPEVRDNGHFFQTATIEKVNAIVAEIHGRFGKDLGIETFESIPERLRPKLNAEKKEVFYDNWIQDQARQARTNGVFILIVRNPSHLEIASGKQTQLKAFTLKDRDELRDLMIKRFRAREFDEGILEAAQFVLNRMDQNIGPPPPPAPPATQPTTLPAGPETAPSTRPSADNPAVKQ